MSKTTTTSKPTFCSEDCRLNLNGCSYCGREGLAVGVREYGTVQTLSGTRREAYKEVLTISQGRATWGTYTATGQPVRGPQALRSFQAA